MLRSLTLSQWWLASLFSGGISTDDENGMKISAIFLNSVIHASGSAEPTRNLAVATVTQSEEKYPNKQAFLLCDEGCQMVLRPHIQEIARQKSNITKESCCRDCYC